MAGVLALGALGAPAAHAGSIQYEPLYTFYGSFSTIYVGAPGERNDMRVDGTVTPASLSGDPGVVRFTDLAGIGEVDPGSGCSGAALTYLCPWRGYLGRQHHRIRVRLGDRDDKLALRQTDAQGDLHAETPCPLFQNRCVPLEIDAGVGNDFVDVADGARSPETQVSCGLGLDVVFADPDDVVGLDCERVTRQRTAAPQRGARLTSTGGDPTRWPDPLIYRYEGVPGAANDMRVDLSREDGGWDGTIAITDLTGISQSADCTGFLLRYECALGIEPGAGAGQDRAVLALGDGDDRIRLRDTRGEAARQSGTATDCFISGHWEHETCQSVTIDAGTGDDYVDIRDGFRREQQLSACGGGYDVVVVDPGESVPVDCEAVGPG